MKFSGGWGGAGTSSFLPTGSSEWEEGPHGPALEVPLKDRMMVVVLSGKSMDQLSRCLLRMGMMVVMLVVAVMSCGVEWKEGPYASSGVI